MITNVAGRVYAAYDFDDDNSMSVNKNKAVNSCFMSEYQSFHGYYMLFEAARGLFGVL